jgi:hypothetical protein
MQSKEERLAYQREYYRTHRDKQRQYKRKWYQENKDKVKEYQSKNKEYFKDASLRSKYGIGLDEYNEMFISQDGKCYICGIHQSEQAITMSVDHNHATGQVRKLLCHKCNNALGCVNDNTEILSRMIDYINEH